MRARAAALLAVARRPRGLREQQRRRVRRRADYVRALNSAQSGLARRFTKLGEDHAHQLRQAGSGHLGARMRPSWTPPSGSCARSTRPTGLETLHRRFIAQLAGYGSAVRTARARISRRRPARDPRRAGRPAGVAAADGAAAERHDRGHQQDLEGLSAAVLARRLRAAPITIPTLLAVAIFLAWIPLDGGQAITRWAPGGILVARAAGAGGLRPAVVVARAGRAGPDRRARPRRLHGVELPVDRVGRRPGHRAGGRGPHAAVPRGLPAVRALAAAPGDRGVGARALDGRRRRRSR